MSFLRQSKYPVSKKEEALSQLKKEPEIIFLNPYFSTGFSLFLLILYFAIYLIHYHFYVYDISFVLNISGGNRQPIPVEDYPAYVAQMHSNQDYLFTEEYSVS